MHPSQPNDHHPLVTAYPQFGPLIDDHDAENVGPLVADLAWRANTDGQRAPQSERGTRWEALTAATLQYLAQRHLTAEYQVEELTNPAAAWLREQVRRRAGIVLLLGVWELQETQWRRVGGHYVTVAGLSLDGEPVLGVADPLADMAAGGNRGRAEPMDPSFHSCRLAPRAHDDAAVVSLDTWTLVPSDLPLGQPVLLGYFTPRTYGEAAAFRGQNTGAAFAAYAGDWQRGPVVMALDAGMAIIPRGAPPATASPAAHSPSAPIPTTSPTPAGRTLTPPLPSATPTTWPATSPSANPSWRRIWLPLGLRRR